MVAVSSSVPARLAGLILCFLFFSHLSITVAEPAPDASRQSAEAVRDAVRKALVRGPTSVAFKDQAVLALPEHFGFIPKKEAAALMSAMGNQTGEDFLGLIIPLHESEGGGDDRWFVSVQYDPAGYIKDDDARHWDSDKLLQTLKDGTEAGNEERQRVGIAPIEVTRWIEAPQYDPTNHRLVWSAEAKLIQCRDYALVQGTQRSQGASVIEVQV
jgi:uncharacterized membrane-anchored protein